MVQTRSSVYGMKPRPSYRSTADSVAGLAKAKESHGPGMMVGMWNHPQMTLLKRLVKYDSKNQDSLSVL